MTETTEEATVSQDNGLSRSAGTPASAVSGDKVLLPHDHVKDMIPKDLQQQLIKALIPAGAFMTDDHRYYFNGEGPLPSVTTILEILDKPALTTWKQQKAASAMWRYIQGQYGSMPALASEDEAVKWALSEARKSRTAQSPAVSVPRMFTASCSIYSSFFKLNARANSCTGPDAFLCMSVAMGIK